MPTVTESIFIARPRQDVWDYLEDVSNTPRWNPMFVHQELVDADELAPGVTIRSVASILGKRIETDALVTEVDAPSRSTLQTESPIPCTGSYLFEDAPGGTRFTWTMTADPGLGGVFGTIADAVVVKVVETQLRRSLNRLQKQLEAELSPA